jgi:hypothetical protein
MHALLPWVSVLKGLYMMLMVIYFADAGKWLIFTGAILCQYIYSPYSWMLHVVYAFLFGLMEIIVVSSGEAWTYTHPDIWGIPLYLLPLWSIAAECIVGIHTWAMLLGDPPDDHVLQPVFKTRARSL